MDGCGVDAGKRLQPVRIILMGPPGAGKGTQAKLLAQRFGVPHISSGDLLRTAAKSRTAMGLQAKRYMDRGELVPDNILLGGIEERLRQADSSKGFILDGFPRTVAQAQALDAMLAKMGKKLDSVISINVPREEVVKRISGRRTCRDCGALYHVIFDPPSNAGICNKCNGELFQRDDDQEDTVLARLEVYEHATAPLLETYRRAGVLRDVDGVGSQDQVLTRILDQVHTNG